MLLLLAYSLNRFLTIKLLFDSLLLVSCNPLSFPIDSYILPHHVACHGSSEILHIRDRSTSQVKDAFVDLVITDPFNVPMPVFRELNMVLFNDIVEEEIIEHLFSDLSTGFRIPFLYLHVRLQYMVRYELRFNAVVSRSYKLSSCKGLVDLPDAICTV